MNLYRDQPGLRNRRIGFGVVDGLDAVKPDLDAWALGADAVIVPLAQRLHGLFLGGGVGPSEDLDLTSGHAWANLVNVASSECTSTKLVEPSSAATSYLVKKIEGSGSCLSGSRMPLGGPYLSSTQIQAIRAWIDQGALDD